MTEPTILFPAAAILSFILTGAFTFYARRKGMMDHPGERHSHTIATPRGGGAGLILALAITSTAFLHSSAVFWVTCALPGVIALALLGWWDDHSPLSARLRFSVQLIVSLALLWCIIDRSPAASIDQIALAYLFLVWMINSYNFMDGSNGMAGSQGVFAGLVMAWLFHLAGDAGMASVALLLAACCTGFLPWNLGNARVFMGDVGSLALGFAIGVLLVYGVAAGAFELPVAAMVMLVFLIDSTLTLLLRVLKRERWYNAHKQHLYQRLIGRGWTHSSVLFLYQSINLLLVVPGIAVAVNFPELAWIVAVLMILAFGLGWTLAIRTIGVLARAG